MTNIAQADCYIFPVTLTKSCILHKKEIAVLQVFCCIFTLKEMLTEYTSLKFNNALSASLLNKQMFLILQFLSDVTILLTLHY